MLLIIKRYNMVRPSEGDRATIANCFIEKDWKCRRIIGEFPNKRWAPSTVVRIIRQIKQSVNLEVVDHGLLVHRTMSMLLRN